MNTEATGTDAALLARVVQGDKAAFASLYDAWSNRLFALVLHIVVDQAQAEEVLQEVFLEVWRRAVTYVPDKGSVQAWLFTLARRRAIDRVRTSQAARAREAAYGQQTEPIFDSTAHTVEDRLAGSEVHRALTAVGEPHKTTLMLAYFSGLTGPEIAERCGVPLGTVKTRIRDGLRKLRKEMGAGQ